MLETVGDVISMLSAYGDGELVLVCTPGRKEFLIDSILECEPDENEAGATVIIMCQGK